MLDTLASDAELAANGSHYDVLGVSKTASKDDVRAAFRRLILVHHPDRASNGSSNIADKLNEAYTVLMNPASRSQYDAELAQKLGVSERSRNIYARMSHVSAFLPSLFAAESSSSSSTSSRSAISSSVSLADFSERQLAGSEDSATYTYPSRCGSSFSVSAEELEAGDGDLVLHCDGCTERIRVLYAVAED